MADVEVGAKLSLDGSAANNTVKSFKSQIREARLELVKITEEFGDTSREAANAAKRVAELEDAMGDAKSLVDAFNPDTKFRAFGAAINTVTGGFAALQGVMGLVGVESENVQQALLRVQSALAFSQGFAQVQEGVQTFKNLGSVLVNSLGKGGAIGVAIAGVAALGAAFIGLFSDAKKSKEEAEAFSNSMKAARDATAQAIQQVDSVKRAFEQARSGVISKKDALEIYNNTLGDSLGKTNSLSVAETTLNDKAEEYIRITGLKAQANALFALSAQKLAQATYEYQEASKDFAFGSEGTAAVENAVKRRQELETAAANIKKIGEDFLRQVNEGSKAAGINLNPPGKDANPTKGKVFLGGKWITEAEAREAGWLKVGEDPLKSGSWIDPETAARAQIANDEKARSFAKQPNLPGTVDLSKLPRSAETLQFEADAAERNRIRLAEDFLKKESADLDTKYADQKKRNSEEETETKRKNLELQRTYMMATSDLLQNLTTAVGEQTAAGKVFGIAQATINTYAGATEVLRAPTTLPEPFGTIAKIANVAAIIRTGLNAVKSIVKTQVPGASSGGGAAVNAPLQPQLPAATSTQLDSNSLNAIGSATTRAFVLEADITSNQEKIKRLNRAARI